MEASDDVGKVIKANKTLWKMNRGKEPGSYIIEREGVESDIVCPEESHIV